MDVEKSRIVSTEIANVCNTIHELISNDIIALGGEDIEKQVAKLKVLSKEERIKQYIAAIETDKYDFDYWGRPGESSENLQKRQKYFKAACESNNLEDTIDKLRKSAKLGQAKAMLALYFYYLSKSNLEKAYYWIFEAKYYLKKYKFNEQVFEDMPIDYPMLFKCLDKYQQLPCYFYINDLIDNSDILDDEIIKQLEYYSSKGNNDCKVWLYKYYAEYDLVKAIDLLNDLRAYKEIDYNDLISDYIDVTKIIHKDVIAKLELYASQGNSEFKEILVKYYENNDSDKMLDILYENANSKKPEFIYQIIEANGGLNPIFSERYVEFLLRSNVSSNKYVQYLRALLYSNLELCEKFNLTFSTKEAFHCLYNANSNEDYITKALDVKIKEKLCECYEFGIGTKMDLEAASDLWCRKGGHAVELGHFAKACLPEIYLEANFHQIKEYFLNELKVIEYKNTFDEIKEFIAFDFKIKDLFTSDGKYLGKSMLNQLEFRKQERRRLEQERLEAIRKEQERLEAIRKEQERLETIRKEQERLEAIRKEEERVKKEVTQKAKLQEEKTNVYNKKSSEAINSSINISNNANNSNQSKQSNLKIESPLYCCPIPNDNYYYQSQNPDGGGRIAADEKRAIASLRQTYSYPKDLGEVEQPKNFGFRLIMSKQDKQYIQNRVDNKNKLTEYTRKISELPNPYKTFSINKYRKTVWNLSDNDKIVHGQEFAKILEDNFNGKIKLGTIKVKTKNYKYKDRENNISDELYLVERVLTHCPIYAYEITLEIDLKVEYDSSCGDEYFELCNQIEKLYDYRRLSREDTNSLYDNMDEELNEALDRDIKRGEKNKWEAIARTQKVLDAYVKNMFDKYVVFAGKYINVADKQHYIEGIVHRFKIIYNSH
jgi:hypothetical protein